MATSFDALLQAGKSSMHLHYQPANRSVSATPNPRSNLNPLAADAKQRGLKPVLSPNPRPVRENAIAQKAQKDRLKASLATMDWESNANGQANVQSTGPEITIRGLAGPYTVVGSNFAPGTTAADIEAAMLPIGGQMQNCQIVTKVPNVVAEMVFSEKAQADNVIATFNNKKADGRLLRMYLRLGTSSAPPKAPSYDTPPRNAPSEPKANRIDLTHEENAYNKQREQSDRSRRRAEPELQDGSYGFEAKEDQMEVDEDRHDSYRNGPRASGHGRNARPPRDERPLYSDDLYRGPRGRGYR
ncbi:MAG: hypothetical protein LQ339_002872 [Xanthoria mediterranea]|nr:MAG: hypothetical protein LQ339_002872 [Xanthoria mediterranea]